LSRAGLGCSVGPGWYADAEVVLRDDRMLEPVEDDSGLQEHRERLRQLLRKVGALLDEADSALETTAPTGESLGRLERFRVELEGLVQDYSRQNAVFLDGLRERMRKIEEADLKRAMTEQPTRQPRNQARIQELSEELSRELRLERVDAAIKELLDFLSDAEFFAANASTGRKRRLRSLQTAIEKALPK
jgi:hypothetical protein